MGFKVESASGLEVKVNKYVIVRTMKETSPERELGYIRRELI